MLRKVLNYATVNHMVEQGDRIVVGVSGGADSVCLLHALLKLYREEGVTLLVVHINHGIRGEEADRDEQFVKMLCLQYNVEFFSYSYQVRKLAFELGLSEEEAGRRVRYEAFLQVCQQQKCNKIAVAHNKNDNAETVLFHLFRGTGMKGLSGIVPSRVIPSESGNITLIRPLLCVERKEIEEFLKQEDIGYQTDSTNLTEDYSRNKIRNRILAYAMEEINAGAVGNIHETAGKLSEAWEYIEGQIKFRFEALVRQKKESYSFLVSDFVKEPAVLQKGILRKILENLTGNLKDLETKHVDGILSLLDKQVGRYVNLPYNIIAEREYEEVVIFINKELIGKDTDSKPMEALKITIPGLTFIPQIRKVIKTEIINHEKNDPIPKSSCVKWFDYDKIENAVEMRNRNEGDYIQINALGGRKKLKDYFIDQKIPQKLRDSQILITDGNHVIWIPGDGERMSEKYKIEPSTTKVLLMKMIDLEEIEDDR